MAQAEYECNWCGKTLSKSGRKGHMKFTDDPDGPHGEKQELPDGWESAFSQVGEAQGESESGNVESEHGEDTESTSEEPDEEMGLIERVRSFLKTDLY